MTRPGRARTSRDTPSLKATADYWESLPLAEITETFPALESARIGWGEPFCFKCGWLAPVPDGPDAWAGARGWLEVAHLADWSLTGASEPSDCVPLCVECHRAMPPCATREDAIAWLVVPRRRESIWCGWQFFTDAVFGSNDGEGYPDVPNKKSAINDARRAYEDAQDLIGQARRGQ